MWRCESCYSPVYCRASADLGLCAVLAHRVYTDLPLTSIPGHGNHSENHHVHRAHTMVAPDGSDAYRIQPNTTCSSPSTSTGHCRCSPYVAVVESRLTVVLSLIRWILVLEYLTMPLRQTSIQSKSATGTIDVGPV